MLYEVITILSRTHPGLLTELFRLEVPEIAEGIVEIMAVAREPGSRAKIAVVSHDPDVDPIGACIGMRGSRVQNVVSELRGEKIDIINWTPDIARFACAALAPAEVTRVYVDNEEQSMEIIVADDQLVITSYSIHYTKLYDEFVKLERPEKARHLCELAA